MALFEGEESTEDVEGEYNPYLKNTGDGLKLIKDMFSRQGEKKQHREFDEILAIQLFPLIANLGIDREAEIYSRLNKISDKLKDSEKLRLLNSKKVIGIGGKFSSGKSCFINSLTKSQLPEGQRPTTSIATYIVHADVKKNIAITNHNKIIELDDNAISAITHRFYERYHMGFSRIIQNLVIYTDRFPYSNVAILDTPGYNKSDISKGDDNSDAEIAREQLRSVDYLIWLVDSEQGVITQRDLEFISSLNLSTEILVVFTKAGLVAKDNLIKKIEQAKLSLSGIDNKVFDIIAYDSIYDETIIGENSLENFMKMANSRDNARTEYRRQLLDIKSILLSEIKKSIEDYDDEAAQLSRVLETTYNVEHISSILDQYAMCHAYSQKFWAIRHEISIKIDHLITIAEQLMN